MKKNYPAVFCFLFAAFCCGSSAAENNFYSDIKHAGQVIVLTFDDGPSRANTPALLKILRENDVKASFFVQGYFVERYPEIVRQISEEGHDIGSHLYNHENFYSLAKKKPEKKMITLMEERLKKTEKAIIASCGRKPYLLRMPHGYSAGWVKSTAEKHGYITVNWTFGCDWIKMPAEEFLSKMKNNSVPGAILLMHDGGKKRNTLNAVPEIIRYAKSKGLKFVRLSEILPEKKESAAESEKTYQGTEWDPGAIQTP